MKKNVYFTSPNFSITQLSECIQTVVTFRDQWINTNKNSIAKIENEELKIAQWNNGNSVIVIIQVTYYPKAL